MSYTTETTYYICGVPLLMSEISRFEQELVRFKDGEIVTMMSSTAIAWRQFVLKGRYDYIHILMAMIHEVERREIRDGMFNFYGFDEWGVLHA